MKYLNICLEENILNLLLKTTLWQKHEVSKSKQNLLNLLNKNISHDSRPLKNILQYLWNTIFPLCYNSLFFFF